MITVISPCSNMAASPGDLTSLPERRIHCSTGKILVGNREFMSASEALLAYLQQFDGKLRTKQQQDAYELLLVRSKMASHRSRAVDNDLKDSLQELRHRKLKKLLEKKKMEQTGLKREVEDALSRSADLLDRINDDSSTVTHCVSDIGSMTTDVLLSIKPTDTNRNMVVDEDGKRKHVYSYHTPRSRTRTVSSIPVQTNKPALSSRRSSVDSAIPTSILKHMSKRSSSSNSGLASRHAEPTEILKRLRSRSASPLPVHLRHGNPRSSHLAPDWVGELDASSGKSIPSWVNTLDASLEDLRRQTSGGRPAPSWVHDAEKSDITVDSLLLNGRRDIVLNKSGHDKSNLTDSRPGLNFSDLATSGISKYSDKHSFLTGGGKELAPRARSLDESDNSLQNSNPGFKVYSAATSSKDRTLGKEILAESDQLKTSLDRYLERLEVETRSSPHRAGKSKMAAGPRCSSMESGSHVMDGKHQPHSDITGASPILKDSNLNMSSLSEEPTFTPARVRFSPTKPDIGADLHQSPSTDVVLDGDRSWEHPVGAYKSPVYVDDRKQIGSALRSVKKTPSPTLTGSEQPGSIEALKNMLFKLQAEESTSATGSKTMSNPLDLPALQDYNFQGEPGGQSLEKALVHLSRLKNLVQTSQAPSDSASTVTVATSLMTASGLSS
ncbi:uncharacterized protein LOC124279522 [Haliotis rubra]|uniref:uncharacterized protein LOC124279522 n=1 Tax=Haliotis rubra TaxID=36100 RepID=UPI001EE6126D|nr:uncharacterized protein LOC124279522 [Haliotis rubra]XP_046571311.1 uncharacterized protein LOC124279522 [Haliotis rubra]